MCRRAGVRKKRNRKEKGKCKGIINGYQRERKFAKCLKWWKRELVEPIPKRGKFMKFTVRKTGRIEEKDQVEGTEGNKNTGIEDMVLVMRDLAEQMRKQAKEMREPKEDMKEIKMMRQEMSGWREELNRERDINKAMREEIVKDREVLRR